MILLPKTGKRAFVQLLVFIAISITNTGRTVTTPCAFPFAFAAFAYGVRHFLRENCRKIAEYFRETRTARNSFENNPSEMFRQFCREPTADKRRNEDSLTGHSFDIQRSLYILDTDVSKRN